VRVDEAHARRSSYILGAMARDEQWFRQLLDADGVLRDGASLGLEERACFRVFSQDSAPRIRSVRWADFAKRFCDTRIGITTDKRYGVRDIVMDAARVVIARDALRETLLVLARSATDQDVSDAEAGERAAGTYGLAALAKRCKTVFVVENQGGATSQQAALLLSAILAGTELGPIVYPNASDLVGFKTAWSRFQATANDAPYR
jgi:hypothetical protein